MHYSWVKVDVWSWSFGASSFPTEPLSVLQMPDLHLNFDFSVSVASRNTCTLRFVRPIWVQCFVFKVCVTLSIYLKNSCSWCVFKVAPFFFLSVRRGKTPTYFHLSKESKLHLNEGINLRWLSCTMHVYFFLSCNFLRQKGKQCKVTTVGSNSKKFAFCLQPLDTLHT